MLHLLDKSEYGKAKEIVGNLSHGIFPSSVCSSCNPGWIYVDDPKNPTSAFIFMKNLGGTLVGNSCNTNFNNSLKESLDTIIFPKILESGEDFFCVTGTTEGWNESIENILEERKFDEELVMRYKFSELQNPTLNKDVEITQISKEIFNSDSIKNINLVIDDIKLWMGDIDSFFESGCGLLAVIDNELCGWCYSACNVDSRVEFCIETVEKFRNKGIGSTLGFTFAKNCLNNGLKPEWEAMSDRVYSTRIAEKIGFKFDYDYKLYELKIK